MNSLAGRLPVFLTFYFKKKRHWKAEKWEQEKPGFSGMDNFSFAGTFLWDIQTLLSSSFFEKCEGRGFSRHYFSSVSCVPVSCLPSVPLLCGHESSLFCGSFSDFEQLVGPHRENFPASSCLCVSFHFSYLHIATEASDSPT